MKKQLLGLALSVFLPLTASAAADGSANDPLQVMLVPADGGTASGTRADFEPVFNAVTRSTGLHFDIKVGQSYGTVVEAMCQGQADIAFHGAVSYVQANRRGCANLLAVGVEDGESVYYAGMFTQKDSGIESLDDLHGRSVSFGDINSASSFTFQMAMLLEAGMEPVQDLGRIRMTGSHANSISALAEGQVDVASLSFSSFEKAVRQGVINPAAIDVVERSVPIPNPPLALRPGLPDAMKSKLREAFHTVHKADGVTPEMIRGYGGKQVDRFNAEFPEEKYQIAGNKLDMVSDELKGEILRAAGKR